jgi:hypothetical protein
VGTWKFSDIKLDKAFENYPPAEKEMMIRVYSEAVQGLINKRELTFDSDGKFTVATPNEVGKIEFEYGTWEQLDDKKLITTIDKTADTLQILVLSKSKFSFSDPTDIDQKELIFLKK